MCLLICHRRITALAGVSHGAVVKVKGANGWESAPHSEGQTTVLEIGKMHECMTETVVQNHIRIICLSAKERRNGATSQSLVQNPFIWTENTGGLGGVIGRCCFPKFAQVNNTQV